MLIATDMHEAKRLWREVASHLPSVTAENEDAIREFFLEWEVMRGKELHAYIEEEIENAVANALSDYHPGEN